MDLLTIYALHSELQVITGLSLIFTLYKLLHGKSSPACCVFTNHSLITATNNGDSLASRGQDLSSQPPVQNSILNPPDLSLSVILRLTVSRPVCLGIKPMGSPLRRGVWPIFGRLGRLLLDFASTVYITTSNWLMLFRETVAVYCKNRTEHTDTLCEQNE
jgi:hypothetical protein